MSIRFAAVGLSHNHIYGMTQQLLQAGAELIWFWDYPAETTRIAAFAQQFPQAKRAATLDEILADPALHLIVSAVNPAERAALGIQVMQQGKDYLTAKPGFTTLEQLVEVRRVQAVTKRFYTIYFNERLASPATVKAGELVHRGAIGQVIHVTGFGPHRLGEMVRPEWTYHRQDHGGILNDIGSHQIDQFLYFTSSTHASITAAHVANFHHPQYPNMDDFGEIMLRSDHATGYCRVDWLTPAGLETWGDVRLFLVGTAGTIEIRKNVDLGRSATSNHLFLVDEHQTQVINCADVALPFAGQLISDILHRTETAITQTHVFLASELALLAESQAHRINYA